MDSILQGAAGPARGHPLRPLLLGTIETPEQLGETAARTGLRLDRALYACLLIAPLDTLGREGAACAPAFGETVLQILAACLPCQVIPADAGEGALCLLLGREEDQTADIERAGALLSQAYSPPLLIASGGWQRDPLRLWLSYQEAQAALAQGQLEAVPRWIPYQPPERESAHFFYPPHRIRWLFCQFHPEDERIRQRLEDLMDEMGRQRCSRGCIMTEIMGYLALLARAALDRGVDVPQLFGEEVLSLYRVFGRYTQPEQLHNWLANLLIKTREQIDYKDAQGISTLIGRITQYLEESYAKEDVSLESAAKHFSLHPSYLSRVYRQQAGEGFIEALTRIRMERAKRLLRHSSMGIDEIARAVGYSGAKYFGTLFRRQNDLSPSAWRGRAGQGGGK